MKVVTTIIWLSLVFQISCKNKSKNLADEKKILISTGNRPVKTIGFKSKCMDSQEEEKFNFPKNRISPTFWMKDPSIENTLTESANYNRPSSKEVKEAIEFAFKRIPRRGSWFKSYTASKPTKIYSRPDFGALELGRITPQTRLAATGYTKGKGCKGGWLRIGIRAWLCMNSLKIDKRVPTMNVLPVMKKGNITPGKYAYIRVGGSPWYPNRKRVKDNKPGGQLEGGFFVHYKRFTRINGKNYWKTIKNRYIPVNRLARFIPSKHMGVELGNGINLPLAFPIAKNSKGKGIDIIVYNRPNGQPTDKVPYHKAIGILGEKKTSKGKFYRIGKCKWIKSRQVAAAFPTPVPPGVKKGDQWLDINLMRQTIVLYEGRTPLFTTIISTGKGGHATKHGIFRSWWKNPETDMKNEVGANDKYLASSVPWTLFFWKGQALHGAYWHDDFGKKKSHGCINLSPKDARFIYEWATPFLGGGWKYKWTGKNDPGITIQIRRDDDDRPKAYGLSRNFIPEDTLKKIDTKWENAIKKETLEIIKSKTPPTEKPLKK
jgi:L,D-transpeptidase catalytic domain